MKEKREKLNNFSSLGIFLANALTAVLVLVMWVVTHNIWITVGSLILLPFFMMKLFNREVTLAGKIVVALIAAVLFGMFAYFFRYRPVETKPISNDPGVIITEEEINKDEGEKDDTPEVSDQKVITSPYGNWNGRRKTPTAQERLTPTYSNTGGSSKKGETVNIGEGKATSDEPVTIVDTSDSEKKQDEEIKKDVDKGKTKVELGDGIIATTDAKPGDEAATDTSKKDEHKNETPKVDVTSPDVVELKPQTKPDPIPEPLPESEQLKKDAKEMSSDELKDLIGDVKPAKDNESDTTQTEISSDQKSEESTNSDEGTSKSETETKVDESKQDSNTPASDKDAQTEVKGEDEKKPESTNDNNKQEVTTPSDIKTEDKTTDVTEKEPVVTPTQPEYTPVSISSLDGSSAYAGDSVQFKVSGDVKSVDGLNGLKYTFAGGYITVDTNPGEATVITPVVTGKDGKTATASVTVNVLNVQQ